MLIQLLLTAPFAMVGFDYCWRHLIVSKQPQEVHDSSLSLLCWYGIGPGSISSHDALHNSIISMLRKNKVNWYGWFVGSVVFGISSDMWLVEHNLHHAITVRPREDPQYNMLPFFLVSKKS